MGQKFCPNRSISYGFRDINIFGFRKNSRWPPKVAKIEFFQFHIEYSATTLRVKNSVEIALSLTVSKILTFFVFPQNSRWPPKVAKIEIFQFCIEYFPTTLRVKNSVQIALSLTVCEMLRFFVFRKNSRWPPKVAKIEFFQFHIEYSATTLRVKNSVSYGFRDINIFCFSAKIQDGRQKWRKLKFFNCT